jgi:hypothetical protein
MSEIVAPHRPAIDEIPARHAIPPDDRDPLVAERPPIAIPPAFYRDDDVPPPPPDDPHWREWPHNNDREPVSRLILIGLPVAIGALGVFHILAILLVMHFSGLY